MATAKTGWIAADGKWFNTEAEAVRHEVLAEVWKSFPELADRRGVIEKHVTELSLTLMPLAQVLQKPPLDSEETTPEVEMGEGSGEVPMTYAKPVTPAECDHEWQVDTPCALVDTCSKCGEERA